MASIHRDSQGRSPYWYCAYYGADGRRMLKSTKQTDRKAAQKICFLWETASRAARAHELTAAQGRKVIAEMVAISSGEVLEFHSTEDWLKAWLDRKKGSTAQGTLKKYSQVVDSFLAFLGPRAKASLSSVSPNDIARFRDRLRSEGRSVGTCNLGKAMLNIPFESARREGLLTHNPCEAVDNLRSTKGLGREAFSHEEVVKLVALAQGDWKGAVLLAATSGLRLGDIANLQWGSVDLETDLETGLLRGHLRIETAKTGAVVVVPMHADFVEWLSLRQRGIAKASVFPQLSGKRVDGDNGLSNQFGRLVEKAGITRRITPGEGKGRTVASKSFHSLRHTFVSALANNGVASEIRQKLVGHSDAGVHKKYTHHELQIFRDAVAQLPSLNA
jgi:integrase